MPRASLPATYAASVRDINRLSVYVTNFGAMEAKYQYMVAEVVMLRLFSILEQAIGETALKLACGATYTNGRAATVLIPCRSIADATNKMMTSRPRRDQIRYLQWTKAALVERSIRYVLDSRDAFFINVQNNAILLNEMRVVRNEIAHRTKSTRQEYRTELARIYGAKTNLTVGAFLTSSTRHPRSNIVRYIRSIPIIVRDISRG